MSPSCQSREICKSKNETICCLHSTRRSWIACPDHYHTMNPLANGHFCGDDDQRIEDPSHRHSRVRRPLLWNLLSRAKFNHLLLFNISYQLPHIWMILMALMSRPLRLNRPNFKRSENRGHLRPFNSHFQMLKCVIIQVVLLFDKVLAFVNISVKYKYYIVRSILSLL